jgi:hypothetical protein
MTEVSQSMRKRGAIVAAAGIFLLSISQASLIDPSGCRSAPEASSTADDATGRPSSSGNTYRLSRACASLESQPQRPRAVEPKFPDAVEIAGDGPQFLSK